MASSFEVTLSSFLHWKGEDPPSNTWRTHRNQQVPDDVRNLWLPATIIHRANNGSYLVQVIGGGKYRHAHDHIQECHLDAVKPDTSNISNVAPAASTSAPATQTVRLLTTGTPTTPMPAAPAATLHTPYKALPTICSPQWTQMPSTWASELDRYSPCCPMPINWKQEATIQASWRDIDFDCPSQMNLMIPWPRMPLVQLLKYCTLN